MDENDAYREQLFPFPVNKEITVQSIPAVEPTASMLICFNKCEPSVLKEKRNEYTNTMDRESNQGPLQL